VSSERAIWKLSVVIEATKAEKEAALEAIARMLCPDDNHEGECDMPWTTIATRFEDLDPDEQASWHDSFADERPPST
jgi:hypothetical protein